MRGSYVRSGGLPSCVSKLRTARLSALENLSRALLRKVSARMLIVDEVHHLLAGNYREQRASLNLLKFLANDLKIAVVLVGTQDAVMALQTDPQMVSRFARLEVPRWQETEAFRSLLAAFEMVLPLRRPSNRFIRRLARCADVVC
ncbi:TniB family NTP-binding protein [Cupriavidus basilensis]|uniref:TniB family NTP-binding protein n=1 Tax=Cupriavidus basilensis TaxID=68895 RepID=A0ABT6AG81_9BURK|nr:TniB family NTP-binding protein [Cupriavidus basilensis]MDF3831610.1 TniB family NTP-binding protein [Cupriavidus basilensis]